MSKVYDNVKDCKFFATGTCADIYITKDDKIVKVVKLKNTGEFDSKKRAIKSCYAEHEIINLVGTYKSYGVKISEKYGFITMDKINGKSLHDLYQDDEVKFVDPDDAIDALKDWTKQLIYIHDLGICHYSLHKSNLFINKNKGYVIDYGNAVLDFNYDNIYKYMVYSDKIKNNYRKIYHIQDDFVFFLRNTRKFIKNIITISNSVQYHKIKKLTNHMKKTIRTLRENEYPKYNHAEDFYDYIEYIQKLQL